MLLENSNEKSSKEFQKYVINLTDVNNKIFIVVGEISRLNLRKELINNSLNDLKNDTANIDVQRVKLLYNEAKFYVKTMEKTSEDLIDYHNKMLVEKSRLIAEPLHLIEKEIAEKNQELSALLKEKDLLEEKIANKINQKLIVRDRKNLIKY